MTVMIRAVKARNFIGLPLNCGLLKQGRNVRLGNLRVNQMPYESSEQIFREDPIDDLILIALQDDSFSKTLC